MTASRSLWETATARCGPQAAIGRAWCRSAFRWQVAALACIAAFPIQDGAVSWLPGGRFRDLLP